LQEDLGDTTGAALSRKFLIKLWETSKSASRKVSALFDQSSLKASLSVARDFYQR